MKKIMKNIAAATLAVAALAVPFAARAAADGDIFEIVPVDKDTYEQIPPWTEPLPVGEEVCFAVRLMKPDIVEGSTIRRDGNPFRLAYKGVGSIDVDKILNLPSIGIWVNGKFTTARLKAWDRFSYPEPSSISSRTDVQLTDFVFSYKVEAGDFALPVYLAMADRSMASLRDPSAPPSPYYLDILQDPLPTWMIDDSTDTSNATRRVNFYYGDPRDGLEALIPTRSQDYDLSKCNFMIKTVDFDNKDESDKYWRTIHRHATDAQSASAVPSFVIKADDVPTKSVTLYVWSENPEAVEVVSGRDVDKVITCNVNTSKTATASRQVGVITIGASNKYEFNLRGVAETNEATIVLSASTNFFYNALDKRLTNYLTRVVCCVGPKPASIAVKPGEQSVTATSDYTTYATKLDVSLSQNPVDEDFEVEIKPEFDDTSCKWWEYFRISGDSTSDPTLMATPNGNPRLLFPVGSTVPTILTIPTVDGDISAGLDPTGSLYLFALRSDAHVDGSGSGSGGKIQFSVSTTNETALLPSSAGGIDGWSNKNQFIIKGAQPVVASVTPPSANPVVGVPCNLKVCVSDLYADMNCGVNDGYQVWIKLRDDDSGGFKRLDGLYYPDSDGMLWLTNTVGPSAVSPRATYVYPGENKSELYLVSPVSGRESTHFEFTVTVDKPAGYRVSTVSGESKFTEGTDVDLKIELDAMNTGEDMYAFIRGVTEKDHQSISCMWKAEEGGEGLEFKAFDTGMMVEDHVTLTDGDATTSGKRLNLEVVMLNQREWTTNASAVVTRYMKQNTLVVYVKNVVPTVDYVDYGLGKNVSDGGTVPTPYPMSVTQTFSAYVTDPGEVDWLPPSGSRPFQVRWVFTDENGVPYAPTQPVATITQNDGIVEVGSDGVTPGEAQQIMATCGFDFPSAGRWTVTVDARDKDMGNKWSPQMTFYVNVIDQPVIEFAHDSMDRNKITFYENDAADQNGYAQFSVKLSLNECDFPMDVKLLVAPTKVVTEKQGSFILQQDGNVRTNGVETIDGEDYQSYIVTFPRRQTEIPVVVQSMDGTRFSDFKMLATNITETVVPRSGGKRACDYYVLANPCTVHIVNVAPTIDERADVSPVPGTNAIHAAIGTADPITWQFDDIDLDFEKGIKVWFKGGGGWGPYVYTNRYEAEAAGATGFQPKFKESGLQEVSLHIDDGDPAGTIEPIVWSFQVEDSKTMTLVAHGPASGDVTKYNSAAGLGQGRVWAESNSEISADSFASTINCGLATSWRVYGYGYKVGDLDDKVNLHRPDGFGGYTTAPAYYDDRDTPLNGAGANKGADDAFAYVAPLDVKGNPVDSFLYAWLLKAASQEGGTSSFSFLNETTSPEYIAVGRDSGKTVELPSEQDDSGKYSATTLEAIFSIEYLASDNMGDINLDGIPDVYINKYGFGQVDTEAGTASGTDVTKLDAFNDDADFLPPSATAAYGMLIPGLADSWITDGRPFTAKLEIRGNGESLNNSPDNNSWTRIAGLLPDRVYTDPDVDTKSTLDGYDGDMPVEYLAWLDYAAANGLDPAETNNWTKWSPERPTDPTVYDTDGDGFPDGYEYFIWYRAHVGYNDGGVHRYLTGRAYDPRNPGDGKFIPREVIEENFDPVRANSEFSDAQDTDNDGLPDLVEFAIGTNPIDFDTDGDGLPDGYEIMLAATSPLHAYTTTGICDAMRNYDGDAMAYSSPYYETHYMQPTPKHTTSLSKFALIDADSGYTDGVQWFVMPTDSVPETMLVYTEDPGSEGLFFKAGDNQYVTVDTNLLTVSRGGVDCLAADMSPDRTWLAGTYADTNGVDRVVRLMPARLVAGTVVSGSSLTNFGYVTFPADVHESLSAWPYGRSVSTETTGDSLANIGGFGFLAIGRYKTAKAGSKLACLPVKDDSIAYLHHQVYQAFGFDPRTAWNANTPLGPRWGTALSGLDDIGIDIGVGKANNVSTAFNHAAKAARTREYTLYDEFLVMSFFLNGLADGVMEVQPSTARPWYIIWSQYTTNGRGPNEPGLSTGDENYKGRDVEAGSADENGADTDGDGVPDGWELYVMTGPKKPSVINGVKDYRFVFPAPEGDGYMSSFGPFVPHAKNAGMTDNTVIQVSLKTNYETIGGDGDDLNEYREFAGTDTTLYYASYSTTITRPEEDAKWLNKFFPTDPWDADTDDDGLDDKSEGGGNGPRGGGWGFVYGSPADNGKLVSIPGGGLNPCSVDTDLDGLPDRWEFQFNGETIYSGEDATYAASDNGQGNPLEGLVDGMDGTVMDAFNIPNGRLTELGGIGTVNLTRAADGVKMFGKLNRDYDHDGLDNWQEYMSGTMRCWRYDDIQSAWDAIPDNAYWNSDGDFSPNYALINAMYGSLEKPVIDTSADDGGRGEFWYKTLVDKSSPIYNPCLLTDMAPGSHYLSRVEKAWDPAYVDDEKGGAWYYLYHRIGNEYLVDSWGGAFLKAIGMAGDITQNGYVSCSPLDYDSDHDGMDDYYELFHGMNPLLGGDGIDTVSEGSPCDLVRDAWGGSDSIWKAWDDNSPMANFWTYQVALKKYYKTGNPPRGNGYDFEYFPWLNGLATADPDGDDIRNQNEAIMPKLASYAWHHTDPTPLWMTDSSYARSLTRLFYRMPGRGQYVPTLGDTFKYKNATYYFTDFGGWAPADMLKNLPARFVAYSADRYWGIFGKEERNWMFSFEENEGYDSDHDAMSDCAESAGKLRATSDPQDANSPNRRQAMYFQGPSRPSALQSPPELIEKHPITQESWPNETTFLQFTVEAWVNADTLDDATVVERAIWCAKSKPGDEEYVRKNFQLGIKGGKWYAKYDGNGTLEGASVEIFSSDDAESGKWHHLAASYNGSRFILYVDGTEAATPVETSLQPEYGSSAMVFHRSTSLGPYPYTPGDYWYDMDYTLRPIVIGASLKTQAELGPAVVDPSAAFDVHNGAGWSYYTRFFKGFIDEVRIWDGARTVADIRADMRKRYTRTEAIENRTAFYEGWVKYGNRYGRDSDGDPVSIVPELRYHFSFDSVPGGADEGITAKTPAGFDYYQEADPVYDIRESGAAYLSRPLDWHVAWWTKIVNGDGTSDAPGYGSVYGSTNWVQWVPNTVAHLPRFDGTTLDSFFWSENTCGNEEGSYFFARNAEPASRWTQLTYNSSPDGRYYYTSSFRQHLVCELDGLVVKSDDENETYTNDLRRTASRFTMFRFTGRTALQDGLDMLPLGGAYAKICPEMWDGQGVSTIWEITSDDDNDNGLPDAWEDHASGSYSPASMPIDWDTIVTWNGRRMTAGEAYRHDIATGRIVYTDSSGDSKVATTPLASMKMTSDEDASHTPDWWDDLYGVYGEGGTTDTDNDGLNNYVEYLVSEIFPFNMALDPKKPKSDSTTLDYFRTVGKLYLGEMFTDHDHMEDHWERAAASDTIDANVWDAQRDGDEDGWSNFAEVRYNDWCRPIDAGIIAHSVGGNEVVDAPMPAIRLSVRYNGHRDLAANLLPNLHVATYSDAAMAKVDATFVVPMGTLTEGEDFYIGRWSDRIVRGTLTPGNVSYANIELHRAGQSGSDGYSWIDIERIGGNYHFQRPYAEYYRYKVMGWIQEVLTEKGLTWYQLGASPDNTDEGLSFTVNVDGAMIVNGQTVGVIDLVTGDFELDLSKLAAQYDNKSYKESIYKLKYAYKVPDAQFERVDVSLAQPNSGFVRGGKNSIMAYWDVDNDGAYTPGTDPFGVARDVEVGWRECSVEIELSETSAITPRINLWQGATDGLSSSSSSSGSSGSGAQATTDRLARFGQCQTVNGLTRYVPSAAIDAIRVRVVRLEIDDMRIVNINGTKNPWRILMDREVDYNERNWLHEGDLLGDGALDIDWDYMYDDLNIPSLTSLGYPLTNAVYAVVFGDDDIPITSSAIDAGVTAHPVLITRRFERYRTEPTAVSVNGDSVCRVAQPTFCWKIENEDPWASTFGTTYTAFKVKVWDSSGIEVYDSGCQRMPAADSTGVYNWTAPLYVDCPSPSGSHLVFRNFEKYTWKVYTYNSKFKNDGNGSAAETFRMNVTEVDMSSFGTGIDVRYVGPATNLVNRIHVQAFKTPDFTGIPVAEAVTNASGTVSLTGLRAGTYFLRAYVDTDYDWTLDDWESWGYLSERDHGATSSTKSIFSPVSVTVGPNLKPDTPRILYIEDRDTDGDGFPDAWEAEQNGNVFSRQAIGPVTGDAEFIAVNTNLSSVLNSADTMDSLKRNQLMQMFLLGRGGKYGVSLLTGVSVRGLRSSAGALSVPSAVVEDTVAITSLAIDRTTDEVVLGVGAETEADSIDPVVAALYSISCEAKVTVKVYRTETLAAEWKLAATIEDVSLSSAGTEVRVKLPDGLDTSSGFFKVEIE